MVFFPASVIEVNTYKMWKTFGLVLVTFVVLQMTYGFTVPAGSGDEDEYQTTDNSTDECPTGWIPYGDKCFKLHRVQRKHRKNWQDSSSYCQSIGGSLASFQSRDEEEMILKGMDRYEDFWIGLNDIDHEGDFVWTDGSPTSYFNWHRSYRGAIGYGSSYYSRLDCVTANKSPSKLTWYRRSCTTLYGWVCSLQKGQSLITPTPPPPPNYCYQGNNDWIEFEGMCYFFSFLSKVEDLSWIDSRTYCNSQGGELVSIHGQDESKWITTMIIDTDKNDWWIGLRRYRAVNLYKWSDGTAQDYENWADMEPNDFNGQEECTSVYNRRGKWNDMHCAVKYPYICKKFNHTTEPITYPQTPPMPGPCPTGWKEFNDRCYSFHGMDDGSKRSNWTAARDVCRGLGGDLATIHNQEIQTFITSQLKFSTSGLWIGLLAYGSRRQFRWTDSTELEYTNWSPKAQNTYQRKTCVSTEQIQLFAGTWQKYGCQGKRGWICQGKKNVLPTDTGSTPSTTTLCKAGYDRYGDACYKVSTREQTFEQAKSQCISEGGNLASVRDAFDQAYIKTLLYEIETPLWIGMTLNKESNEYVWVDHIPVLYTSWSNGGGPIGDDRDSCVQATSSGWNDTNCDNIASSLCKIYTGPVPTTPVHIEGHCGAELEWFPYGSHCYYFGGKNTRDYASQAQLECMKRDSYLLTIHHQHENDFIYSQITDANDIWIGLVKGYDGFKWVDDSPVQYSNWAQGEPTNTEKFGQEDCVLMSSYLGDWKDVRCKTYKGFICKKPKIVPTTLASTDQTTISNNVISTPVQDVTVITARLPLAQSSSKGVSTAAKILVAEAVIAVIVAVGVTVWCVIKKRSNSAKYVKRRGNGADMHTGHNFDNALFSTDTSASPRVDFRESDTTEGQDTPVFSSF
ncbi:macrophage mannose receptor 1-like isoform X2 [Glandiceps talaboti]